MYAVPPKTIVIAAGDAGYVPAIDRAKKMGLESRSRVLSNAAASLKTAASRFCPLGPDFEFLRLGGGVGVWRSKVRCGLCEQFVNNLLPNTG